MERHEGTLYREPNIGRYSPGYVSSRMGYSRPDRLFLLLFDIQL